MFTYTIYDKPRDYPGKFVVRRFMIESSVPNPVPEREPFLVSNDLEEIRDRLMQMELIVVPRHPDDDPVIVETWL